MMYTTSQVAEMLHLSPRRVQKAAPNLAVKAGSIWLWTDEAIEKLRNRKGKRGNPNWVKKVKN